MSLCVCNVSGGDFGCDDAWILKAVVCSLKDLVVLDLKLHYFGLVLTLQFLGMIVSLIDPQFDVLIRVMDS